MNDTTKEMAEYIVRQTFQHGKEYEIADTPLFKTGVYRYEKSHVGFSELCRNGIRYPLNVTAMALAIVRGEITVRQVEPEPRYAITPGRKRGGIITKWYVYNTETNRVQCLIAGGYNTKEAAQAEADRLNASG